MDSTTVALLAVLAIVWVYPYIFPTYPDVHKLFLLEQSNISSLCYPGETAVYRSRVTPHGRKLIGGLAIADQATKIGSTRDGNISDLWKITEQSSDTIHRIVMSPRSDGLYSTSPVSLQELKRLVHGLGQWMKNDLQHIDSMDIVVLHATGFDSLVFFFAAALYGFSLVFVPLEEPAQVNSAITKIKPRLIIGAEDNIAILKDSTIPFLRTAGSDKHSHPAVVDWATLQNQFKDEPTTVLDTSSSNYPLKTVALDANDVPVVYSYSTQNIVAAIAAQIKAIPELERWGPKDKVLTYCTTVDVYTLLLQLTGLVSGCTVVYGDRSLVTTHPLRIVGDIKPTILVTEELSTYSLAELAQDLTLVRQFKLWRARKSLEQRILPKSPVIPEFESLRLIHCGIYRSAATLEDPCLTTAEVNTIRCLTGARVVHALNNPVACGPVAQTGVYDYRISSNDNIVNFGPILPCLEAMLVDHGSFKARDRKGRLMVRGPAAIDSNTSYKDAGWQDTHLLGLWGSDGCFRFRDNR